MTSFRSLVSRQTLETLLAQKEQPLISLYLPLHQEGSDARENAHRLNGALSAVEQRLGILGLSPKGCAQFLAPARAYAEQELHVPHGGQTLALFLSPALFRAHVLPPSTSECTVIGSHFHIAPLLPYLRRETSFYVLALSKKRARLLHVSDDGVAETEVEGMPKSMQEAWQGMEHGEKNLQSHAAGHGLMFHGQGGAKDEGKKELEGYVFRVAKSVDHHLQSNSSKAPLVFAGVEQEWGMYHKASEYPHLIKEFLHGNPDDYAPEELAESAVPLLQGLWQTEKDKILAAYGDLAGTGRTSTDLQAILDLSYHGKIEILLVKEGALQWGAVNEETGVVQLHEHQQEGDVELIGIAAAQTLQHGGWVAGFPADKMPEGATLAAMLRY